jgi:hypothetical protein
MRMENIRRHVRTLKLGCSEIDWLAPFNACMLFFFKLSSLCRVNNHTPPYMQPEEVVVVSRSSRPEYQNKQNY